MLILSDYLQQSTAPKFRLHLSNLPGPTLGSLGVAVLRDGNTLLYQTCIVGSIEGSIVTVHPVVAIDGDDAICLLRGHRYGLFSERWTLLEQHRGQEYFFPGAAPTKRMYVEEGRILEGGSGNTLTSS